MLLPAERYGGQHREQQSVDSHTDINCLRRDLTEWLFGGQDDRASFLMLPCWKVTSLAYTVTDAYVVTTATRLDPVGSVWIQKSDLTTVCLKDRIWKINVTWILFFLFYLVVYRYKVHHHEIFMPYSSHTFWSNVKEAKVLPNQNASG